MSMTVHCVSQSQPGPSGPITAYDWDWGDGSSHDTTQNASHTYSGTGTKTITLTITGTGADGTANVSHTFEATAETDTFFTVTDSVRPTTLAGTPAPQRKPWTTIAGLRTLLASAVSGDYLYYNGTGVLTVQSPSAVAFALAAYTGPAGRVTIDFGTRKSEWASSSGYVSGNYVEFDYTGTGNQDAFYLRDCSNLYLYGGSISSGIGGAGIRMQGNVSDVTWLDFYVHDVGGTGVLPQPIDSHTGDSRTIDSLYLRGTVERPCMNPAYDPHADKGSGIHGFHNHGSTGKFDNCTVFLHVIYPLQPGEHSAGKDWPEGALGSALEIGTDNGKGQACSQNDNTYAYLLENAKFMPYVKDVRENPGSTAAQTGSNGINFWGSIPLNGNVVLWAENRNTTGANIHVDHGAGTPGSSPRIVVEIGRGINTNQYVGAGGNISDRYQPNRNIDYVDCT